MRLLLSNLGIYCVSRIFRCFKFKHCIYRLLLSNLGICSVSRTFRCFKFDTVSIYIYIYIYDIILYIIYFTQPQKSAASLYSTGSHHNKTKKPKKWKILNLYSNFSKSISRYVPICTGAKITSFRRLYRNYIYIFVFIRLLIYIIYKNTISPLRKFLRLKKLHTFSDIFGHRHGPGRRYPCRPRRSWRWWQLRCRRSSDPADDPKASRFPPERQSQVREIRLSLSDLQPLDLVLHPFNYCNPN